MAKEKQQPTFGYALFVMVVCFAFVMIPTIVSGAKIHVMFLLSWLLAYPLCMKLGYSFKELQDGQMKFIPKCIMPMLLLLTIGSVVGTWCASGTIAYITVLGLKIIDPNYFLATSFVVGLIFACMTGTSFGTVGTIGVALMGVAIGMEIDHYVAAAAIISAALIRDGLSPMSDTPNVICGSSGVDVFESIKFQLPMTVPIIILTFLYYYVLGATGNVQTADTSSITALISSVEGAYKLGPICLLPVGVVLFLLVFKFPTIPALLLGSVTGGAVAYFVQGVTGANVITCMWTGFVMKSDNALLNSLFTRGGIMSMTGTSLLFIFSFGLFGILNECHILETLVTPLLSKVKSRFSGVVCTIILGFVALFSSSASFAEVFTGNIMREVYEQKGLDKRDLVRAATVGAFAIQLYVPYVLMVNTVCGYLDVEGIQMMSHYVTSPLYVIVILIITKFDLDKKIFKGMFKNIPEVEVA